MGNTERRNADILMALFIAAGEGGHLREELQAAWNAGRVVPYKRAANGAVRAVGEANTRSKQ